MRLSILSLSRRGNTLRPRPDRCILGVESMEGRALLASAAVTSAIYMVQRAQLQLHLQVSQEVSNIRNNIVGIRDSANTYITNAKSDILALKQDELTNPANIAADRAAILVDQRNIKNAMRDEAFAINQENQLIKQLNNLDRQINSTVGSAIKGLNNGRIDPSTVSDTIITDTLSVLNSIMTIDDQASRDLIGFTSTLNTGTA